MKKIYFILFICCVLLQSTSYSQTCNYLIWSDEFDVNGAPNPLNWGYDLGYIANHEFQTYTNSLDNAWVENGELIIQAKKVGSAWTSARLKTEHIRNFTHGRIEFRAKVPVGTGTWPALWMLGQSISSIGWPACGEIDIMEAVGKDPGINHASIHTTSSSGLTVNTSTIKVTDFSTAFHIYAIEWTNSQIDFYVDNTNYYSYIPNVRNAQTWPFDNPCFIIMNVAMGGDWGSDPQYETGGLKNGIDPALTSVKMEVDYVRYYSSDLPKISGNITVKENTTETYSVPSTAGSTYIWTVPTGAEIASGQGTNSIKVNWGSTSGNISLKITQVCGSNDLTPLSVQVNTTPITDMYTIPNLDGEGKNLWNVIPSTGNTLFFSTSPDFQLNYNITNPVTIPYIEHPLTTINLDNFNYIALTLKTNTSNPPSVLRLSLIDSQGDADLTNIFKITNFINDGEFHTYVGKIVSTSTFDLKAITNMKLYVNYGYEGVISNSQIWFKDVQIYKNDPLKISQIVNTESFKIYPNPAKEQLHLEPTTNISSILIVNILSQTFNCKLSSDGTINVNSLSSGIYTLLITDKQNKITALKFQKK